jgi:hypothetical protein
MVAMVLFCMALKPCRECKKKVSTQAMACPQCGAPHPTSLNAPKNQDAISNFIGDLKKGAQSFKSGWDSEDARIKNPTSKIEEPKIIKVPTSNDGNIFGFWNGGEGLVKTFWLYFIGGNMFLSLLMLLGASEGKGMVMFVLIIKVGWSIFATIGVFNAAEIYKSEKINLGESYGYATGAKITTVVLILSSIGNAL